MNRIFGVMLLLFCGVTYADGQQLHVQSNQQYSVPLDQQELILQELVLEDGASLIIPASVKRFQISAEKVRIGDRVKILAAGADGLAGADGDNKSDPAASCQSGAAGGEGEPGTAGDAGVSLTLQFAIESLGSLSVDTRGGAGGKGGNGGDGQAAGDFGACDAPDGGAGGAAGAGGDGGDGGSVLISYSLLPSGGLSDSVTNRIQINSAGGAGAAAGSGGKGGAGSKGKYINMRTLTGNQKWMGGGDEGKNGPDAHPGKAGSKGSVQILNAALIPAGAVMKKNAPPSATQGQTLDDMRRQLELQSRQLEALSTKMDQTIKLLDSRVKALEKQVNGL